MRRLTALIVLAVATAACFNPPPQAPTEVDDLTRFLFREWGHEDPEVLQDGMVKLEAFLQQIDFSNDLYNRSFQLDSCTAEDVAHVPTPEGQDPATTVGMAVAYESRWSVDDHVRLQVEAKLLPEAEPSAKKYTRRFIEPKDPSCLSSGECDAIYTENDITRDNMAMTIDLMLHKDFKWVEMPDGRRAIVSRSWNPRVFKESSGDNAILQSYTVDVWLERPGGKTWRYQALYQDSTITLLGITPEPDTIVATVTSATDDMFKATDNVIGKHYHGK